MLILLDDSQKYIPRGMLYARCSTEACSEEFKRLAFAGQVASDHSADVIDAA